MATCHNPEESNYTPSTCHCVFYVPAGPSWSFHKHRDILTKPWHQEPRHKHGDYTSLLCIYLFIYFQKNTPTWIMVSFWSLFVASPYIKCVFVCVFQDWNQMLGSLANLKFCTQLSDTDLLNEQSDINSPPLLTHADELNSSTQQKSEVISKLLLVPIMHTGHHLDHNSISATLLGSQLGLKGMYPCSKGMQFLICSGCDVVCFFS